MTEFERYSRQILFEKIGLEGQRRIRASRVVLAGCGALGSVSSSLLVRAGVGTLRIIDRDFIEPNNLQRQMLFDEEDIREGLPKAEAARRKLSRVNSDAAIEARVSDIEPANAEELLGGFDLIIDATDNFETRYLINDFAVKTGTPWVYAAAAAAEGRTMTVVPGETPCLRCVFEQPPQPGEVPTCETVGIIGPAAAAVAALQATEALKLLAGRKDELRRGLLSVDAWKGTFRTAFAESAARSPNCPTCAQRKFEFLEGRSTTSAVRLCGRNAVHVSPAAHARLDLDALASRLRDEDVLVHSEYMLRFEVEEKEVTVFPDGRAIIKGTTEPAAARTLYARYVGM
jgi:adenylyltransferase/sulfurtransferase